MKHVSTIQIGNPTAQATALTYLVNGGFEFTALRTASQDLTVTVPGFDRHVVSNEMGRAGLKRNQFYVTDRECVATS